MNYISKFVSIIFLLMGVTTLYGLPSSNLNQIKEMAIQLQKKYNIPGIAVEAYQDGVPSSYYMGYANLEKKTPITKNTIFELGSLSNIMTSLLLAQEIDMANMSLNDSIKKYLPKLSNDFSDISLQSLATHTSGLPTTLPANIQSTDTLWTYLSRAKVDRAPNDEWVYSNVDVGLLGYAVEQVAHKPFDQLYKRHILNPLKMQPIGTSIPKTFQKFCAQGYDENGKEVLSSNNVLHANSIKASANDMQHFLKAAIGLKGTSDRVFYPMRMTQTPYVKLTDRMQGLGWQIYSLSSQSIKTLLKPENNRTSTIEEIYDRPTYNGNVLIEKVGLTNGFRIYMALIPDKKSGVVILVNKAIPNTSVIQVGREMLLSMAKLS